MKKDEIKIILPLHVHTTKSETVKGKFILNLNIYRNANWRKLGIAKKNYKKLIANKIPKENTIEPPYELIYTYYHGNKSKVDISNPLSIIDKFTCDVLTEAGFWKDDDKDYVKRVTFQWGGVDKNRPRAELIVKKFNQNK